MSGWCRYREFIDHRTWLQEPLTPTGKSEHFVGLSTITGNGARIGLRTTVVSPFLRTVAKRNVQSALHYSPQINDIVKSHIRLNSDRAMELQARLRATDTTRVTLEARENASATMSSASYARLGCDYSDENGFVGVKMDAVNGPTLEATAGVHLGAVSVGAIAAYDVGLDHSDRLGRVTVLDMAASVVHEDVLALFQVNDKMKLVQLDVTQCLRPELLVGSQLVMDRRKETQTLRAKVQYDVTDRERLSTSLGSDGYWIGAYEWQTSSHLRTRVQAQMDIRHYDSDSHHLGVSIEIS